mgnify:CR=1 FL=1
MRAFDKHFNVDHLVTWCIIVVQSQPQGKKLLTKHCNVDHLVTLCLIVVQSQLQGKTLFCVS